MSKPANPDFLEETPLLNVHEVLAEAAAATRALDEPMTSMTFRLPTRLKTQVDAICSSNGTNSSEFYRQCGETLVSDYLP